MDFSSTGAYFTFTDQIRVNSIMPRSVSAGDLMIRVYGEGFMASESLKCRLGSNLHVKASFITSSHVTCSTGSLRRGNYSVALTFNGADFYESGFELEAIDVIEIERIIPSTGPVGGANAIRVITTGVVPSGKVGCIFGEVQSVGSHVSDYEISCVPPTEQTGTAEVRLLLGSEASRAPVPFVYYSGSSATVTSALPCVGALSGGLRVLVTGAHLRVSGEGSCRVD